MLNHPESVTNFISHYLMEDRHIPFMLQATARGLLGTNTTAFTKITDGNTVVKQGELVSLAVKPATIGRIMYFSIAQVDPLSLLHVLVDCSAQDAIHEQKPSGCSADEAHCNTQQSSSRAPEDQ